MTPPFYFVVEWVSQSGRVLLPQLDPNPWRCPVAAIEEPSVLSMRTCPAGSIKSISSKVTWSYCLATRNPIHRFIAMPMVTARWLRIAPFEGDYIYLSALFFFPRFLSALLSLGIGDRNNKGWHYGENVRTGKRGWFPLAYTTAETVKDADVDSGYTISFLYCAAPADLTAWRYKKRKGKERP